MILVDTSVWIDHFRSRDPALTKALRNNEVLLHDYVAGELALGNFRDRAFPFRMLADIDRAPIVSPAVVLGRIETDRLYGTGIGYVDVHLLESVRMVPNAKLWTRDKRLAAVAGRLKLLSNLQ